MPTIFSVLHVLGVGDYKNITYATEVTASQAYKNKTPKQKTHVFFLTLFQAMFSDLYYIFLFMSFTFLPQFMGFVRKKKNQT